MTRSAATSSSGSTPVIPGRIDVGIDSGASKTELLSSNGITEFSFVIPEGINFQRLGMDETIHSLAQVFRRFASEISNANYVNVCIGLAGADAPEDRSLVAQGLRVGLGKSNVHDLEKLNVHVIQDSVAAFEAAFPKESGAVVVTGTGSIVIARDTDGTVYRTGGWGYLLGDEGSGFAIGLSALRWLAQRMDEERVPEFGVALQDHLKIGKRADLIYRVYRESGIVQTVAPLVIEWVERGDAEAIQIVKNETSALARCFERMISKIESSEQSMVEKRFVLTGGLSGSTIYRGLIAQEIVNVAEGWELVEPVHPRPVYGALSFAQSM